MKMVAKSHTGLVRLKNEDAVYADSERGIAILADGMGGLLAGEEASLRALRAAQQRLERSRGVDACMALETAHSQLCRHAKYNNYFGKMGTTLIVWEWTDRDAAPNFAHVGDSRLYSYREGKLEQISKDQTLAQKLMDQGLYPNIPPKEVPNRNVLTQAVGMPGDLAPEVGSTGTDGRLLLCSDGLSDMVEDPEIAACMQMAELEDAATELVKIALDAGGKDNVSVVLIDFDLNPDLPGT